jgi:hypothetical protein
MTSFDQMVADAIAAARTAELSDAEVRTIVTRAQRRWWHRFMRGPALIAVGAALVIAGGAAAGLFDRDAQIDKQVVQQGPFKSSGSPALDRLIAASQTKPALAPLAGTFTLETRVADPAGGAPWVLVVWRTRTGGWCTYPGREQAGRILGTRTNGALGTFPFQEGGSCSDKPLARDGVNVAAQTYAGGPTTVHGVVGKDVVAVRVPTVPGVGELTPSDRGGFLAVIPGEDRSPTLRLELQLRDGRTRIVGG